MSLIKLKLAEDNTVTASGWANPNQRKVGDIVDGFTVYDIADEEIEKLVIDRTKLISGHLVVDADYIPPVEEPVEETPAPPTEEQIALSKLAVESAEHGDHIKSLEEALTELATSNLGGN